MRLSHAKLFSSALHIRAVAGNRSLHKAVTGGLSRDVPPGGSGPEVFEPSLVDSNARIGNCLK